MPQVRKLAAEEVQAIQNKSVGTRKLTEQLYDSILADYEVGEYGEAVLDEGENRLTVRNRMRTAASRRGFGIEFRRTSGDLIRFKIVEQGGDEISNNSNRSFPVAVAQEAAAPPVSSEAPPKNKGGRPKKQEQGAMERLGEIADKMQDAAKGALEDIGLREPVKRKGGRPKKYPVA